MKNTVFDYSEFVRETEIKLEEYISLLEDLDSLIENATQEFDQLTFKSDFKPNCKQEVSTVFGKIIKFNSALNNMRSDILSRVKVINTSNAGTISKGSNYSNLLLTFKEISLEQLFTVEEYIKKCDDFLNEKEIKID